MDFDFFILENKSGYKTRENWFRTNHPSEYFDIINYSKDIDLPLSFKEKIYFYFHKMTERPKCVSCGSEIKFRERFDKPYGDFCSLICINSNKKEMSERQIKTNKIKYGVDYYPQHKDFIVKQRKTKKEKYGDENFNNQKKSKLTRQEKYGDENYANHEKQKQTCLTKYGVDNYSKSNNYQNELKKKFINIYPDIEFIQINKNDVTIKCGICNDISNLTKQLLYERHRREYIVCTNCNPIGMSKRSGYEKEICQILKSYGIVYDTNKKIEGVNYEIDIYIPSHKLGIEFNGLYWHNELFKNETYHLTKSIIFEKKGIKIIHIFEDEWIYKKDIVVSIILNRLGKTKETIYGRKCSIKEIDNKTSKKFMETNHIQGGVNSKVNVGLYYDDRLVSLMTFSKGRVIMGGKKDEWELNRFCNLINTNVVGASSKLLKYFIDKFKPEKIVSYSDIRLFDGVMYEKIGFNKISQSKPNYWYVKNDLRFHRFNFRKSILVKEGFDSNKTEKEIMFDRGIYRIYDCGNIRWEKIL